MSDEIAIIELINNQFSYVWSLVQWWGSISFGLIAMAHVARKILNIYLVTIIPILYSAYTIYMIASCFLMIQLSNGYQNVLLEMANEGVLSTGGLAAIEAHQQSGKIVRIPTMIFLGGTYISTIAYLIYNYKKNRISNNSNNEEAI